MKYFRVAWNDDFTPSAIAAGQMERTGIKVVGVSPTYFAKKYGKVRTEEKEKKKGKKNK